MQDNDTELECRAKIMTTLIAAITICFVVVIISLCFTSCCTLSFSNVLTDGTATDVIDDTQSVKSDPDISPTVSIPAAAL